MRHSGAPPPLDWTETEKEAKERAKASAQAKVQALAEWSSMAARSAMLLVAGIRKLRKAA
jgi:hypothetical protein